MKTLAIRVSTSRYYYYLLLVRCQLKSKTTRHHDIILQTYQSSIIKQIYKLHDNLHARCVFIKTNRISLSLLSSCLLKRSELLNLLVVIKRISTNKQTNKINCHLFFHQPALCKGNHDAVPEKWLNLGILHFTSLDDEQSQAMSKAFAWLCYLSVVQSTVPTTLELLVFSLISITSFNF